MAARKRAEKLRVQKSVEHAGPAWTHVCPKCGYGVVLSPGTDLPTIARCPVCNEESVGDAWAVADTV